MVLPRRRYCFPDLGAVLGRLDLFQTGEIHLKVLFVIVTGFAVMAAIAGHVVGTLNTLSQEAQRETPKGR
jgi:hypothetical protein